MNCKRIKELIMTDYVDGEASAELQKEVEEHLSTCSQCKQFEQALRQIAVEPFKKAQIIKPPESVWYGIKEAIEEKQSEGLFVGLKNVLSTIFNLRKPVVAMAIVAAVIFIAAVFVKLPFNNQHAVSGYLEEQIDFLSYLDADEINYFNGEYVDLGTTIEEYFL